MGIRDLFTFLHRHGVQFEKHRRTFFKDTTIAVDGYSLFFRLYYAAKKTGYASHKEQAIKLLEDFLEWPKTTTLVFVLDNPVKSDLKKGTIMKRREAEQALQAEIKDLDKKPSNPILRARREALQQRSKETFPQVCRDMIDHLRGKNYRVLVSDGEAERTACEMVSAGEAQYAYSNDSDCLALACPAVIFEESGGFLHVFRLSSVLDPLKLQIEEFTDFCILLGTDFNERVLPPEEAFETIRRYRRLEHIPGLPEETVKDLDLVRRQYHSEVPVLEDRELEEIMARQGPPARKAKKKPAGAPEAKCEE